MSQANSNNVSIGPKEIGAVADSDEDNPDQYIGFLSFSTTGEYLVPRAWLLDQWEEHDLPQWWLPSETSKWSAYRRSIQTIDSEEPSYQVEMDEFDHEFNCRFVVDRSAEEGSNVIIIKSKVFYPEDLIGEEGGDWRETRIGYFDYKRDEETDAEWMHAEAEIEEDNIHYPHWEELVSQVEVDMEKHERCHNISDLQNILKAFREHTNAVEIRRAVYFIGNHYEKEVEALQKIWKQMNEFKEDGESVRIDKTPVVDMESQRQIVATRVEEEVESMVEDIVDETVGTFIDNEDQTADETAREILNELEDSESFAAEYNQLLSMRLSIKDILANKIESHEENTEEIVENVMEQQTFDEVGE